MRLHDFPEPSGVRTRDTLIKSQVEFKAKPKLISEVKFLTKDLLDAFIDSRRDGTSIRTIEFYYQCLKPFIGNPLTPSGINEFLRKLNCGNAKHAYFRAIRALCGWLYRQGHLEDNPILKVDSPKQKRNILPAITEEQLEILLNKTDNIRDKCIISLLFDSGLRLSELCSIKSCDIDWDTHTFKVMTKGKKEGKAAFTQRTATLLLECISQNKSIRVFNLRPSGIQTTLHRMGKKAGFACNAHSFRRGFACHLHKKGLSTLSIMHLGRWSSLGMVERYTRSLSFDECLEHYKQVNGN